MFFVARKCRNSIDGRAGVFNLGGWFGGSSRAGCRLDCDKVELLSVWKFIVNIILIIQEMTFWGLGEPQHSRFQ